MVWGHDKQETEFRGLWQRDKPEFCPPGFATECRNFRFLEKGIESREGSEVIFTLGFTPARMAVYQRIGEAARIIVLDAVAGSLYDTSVSIVVPILTRAGMTDFSMVTMFNRAYITPHNGNEGKSADFLYVYDGTTCRKAAGTPPSGFNLIATTGAAGKIEAGKHLIAIGYRTTTGFYTRPGPTANYVIYTAPGATQVVITTSIPNMPVGPAGTAARVFYASRTLPGDWNGDILSPELFFIPGGTIENNNAGVVNITLDFYDSDLIDSADYLADNHDEIPATLGLMNYNGSLVGWTRNGDGSLWVSKNGEPESLSQVDGFIIADPGVGSYPKSVWTYRGLLYIQKSFGPTYVTQNNGDIPASWRVEMIDSVQGAEVHSVAEVLDNRGIASDRQIIANRLGLWVFNGSFSERPLSYHVESLWKTVLPQHFKAVEVKIDPDKECIYIVLPTAGALPDMILVGDYSEGLTWDRIRWSKWTLAFNPSSILLIIDSATQKARFYWATATSTLIYRFVEGSHNDGVSPGTVVEVPCTYESFSFGYGDGVNHFLALRARLEGAGILDVDVRDHPSTGYTSLGTFTLADPSVNLLTRGMNFVSERLKIRLKIDAVNEWFRLTELKAYAKEFWNTRPGW